MECHCARRSLLSPAVWACGTPPQRPTETHAKTYSEHDRTGQDRSVHQSSKLMPKRPGICKLPDAPNHLELQRVGVGLLEPRMPLVDAKFACSGRTEWLRGVTTPLRVPQMHYSSSVWKIHVYSAWNYLFRSFPCSVTVSCCRPSVSGSLPCCVTKRTHGLPCNPVSWLPCWARC